MKLTKAQRETLRMKFGGRCAYCGVELGTNWHADHIAPIVRTDWCKPLGFQPTGPDYPERDTLENMHPACAPCNIDKHAMPLEDWRRKLENAIGVLARGNATYRHAVRFGLLAEKPVPVVFYFERQAA